MVHNPYSRVPLSNNILPVAQYIVDLDRGVLVEQAGTSMEELLGLAKDWVYDE